MKLLMFESNEVEWDLDRRRDLYESYKSDIVTRQKFKCGL